MDAVRNIAKVLFAGADLFVSPPLGPRILIYHQVGAGLDKQTAVTIKAFEWQLDWLSANAEVVSLEAAIARWSEPGAQRMVVLTFDDGYRDTFSTAFPRLQDYDFPFTLYLATEWVHDESRGLTWSDLGTMAASGLLTVGAHTHTHADLRSPSAEEIVDELETSNALIEERLGLRPQHFAYPWGYWSEAADPIVRRLYKTAVLGARPLRSSPRFDPHMIYRFPIQRSDATRWFRQRLTGGLVFEEMVRRWLRGYDGP